MNESDPREQDAHLAALFSDSLRQEAWPQTPNVPDRIWRRARTAELLDEEIRRRNERQRPVIFGRRIAAVAALLAGEALLLEAVATFPDQALGTVGLTPATAALLALVTLPAVALAAYLRREAVAG
jgi:hypothetical protein